MAKDHDFGMGQRLTAFMDMVGAVLGSDERRASFAMYAHGLMGESARKSVEPLAARATGDERHASAAHQSLHHFVANSRWEDRPVRRAVAKHAIEVMQKRAPVDVWIVDDTGFLKQGKHSVGVQRQYTGSAGKVANCQIGVSLSVANASMQLPIDFELFLPQRWTDDPQLRSKAKIPDEVQFKSKIDLALDMIERACHDDIPGRILLADSFYGHSQPFRRYVELLGLDYAVGIFQSDLMWRAQRGGNVRGELRSAQDIALSLDERDFKSCTWRQGTRRALRSRFALVRVVVPAADGYDARPEWLLVEWPEGEKTPTHYTLTTLPRTMSLRQIVRIVKERYRTEQVYSELKTELGLDHFEGRGFRGWHHHVTVTLCCYAFLVAERARAFSPSARRKNRAVALEHAA